MRRLLLFLVLFVAGAAAQHEHHGGPAVGLRPFAPPANAGSILPGVPMARDGSGTAWLPDDLPLPGIHRTRGRLDLMLHYSAFPRWTATDALSAGDRGAAEPGAPNWLMASAGTAVGRSGRITGRMMLSLDPLTEGGSGYPLLLQTGETWAGEELVDRQHPHDFFGEIAVAYGHALGRGAGVFAYAGLPGEPALGPAGFIHRPSAAFNPDAPLGHHLQDATHITFGVATLGAWWRDFKFDASLFTGREPDENRWNIETPRFDSWSGRLTWNPLAWLSLQVSHGLIKSPEPGHPEDDVRRTTASVSYGRAAAAGPALALSAVWGANAPSHGPVLHSALLEGALARGRFEGHFRSELVQRTAGELRLAPEVETVLNVGTLALGGGVRLLDWQRNSAWFGAQLTAHLVPELARAAYGRWPVSAQAFLRLSPARPAHGH